jgi:D-inositol-3-phosphate glycosyltransferase
MKVFLNAPVGMSRAMYRVEKALKEHCPFQVVESPVGADVIVLHVIGYPETLEAVQEFWNIQQKYIIIQYCLRSTQEPDCGKWLPLWRNAEMVWSYYDLPALAREDGYNFTGINFYHAPLGCDPLVFRPWPVPKKYVIGTSGYVAETETVEEAAEAANKVGQKMFHLGPQAEFMKHWWNQEHIVFKHDISDDDVAQFWSRCQFVAGLRRKEGFELPAVEGIFCGARPVMFDMPHYRKWFHDLAVFIPEGTQKEVTESLARLFLAGPSTVTSEQRAIAVQRFSWPEIATGFWAKATQPLPAITVAPAKPRLLWVGDAGCSSGFARSTHKILETVHLHYDVQVLGLNYFGDPHGYPYELFPCRTVKHPGDFFGLKRIAERVEVFVPNVIVIQNDPWNFPGYFRALKEKAITTPVVGIVAVDGLNCGGTYLNGLANAVFWTEFGRQEAIKGGYHGPSSVIPLGVDLNIYKPMEKSQALDCLGIPQKYADKFIVGCVNRNQHRKRLDLLVQGFATWVKTYDVQDAYLYLHVAPTGDQGFNLEQLMFYYGVPERLILATPDMGHGVHEMEVAATYNATDVGISTSQGEGMGLTTLEGMACRRAQIAVDFAAVGDWARWTFEKLPVREYACTPNYINSIGGVTGVEDIVVSLKRMYDHSEQRRGLAEAGFTLANEPQFRWENIGARFVNMLAELPKTLREVDKVGQVHV